MEPYDTLAYTTSDPIRGVLEYFRGGHLSKPDTWRNLLFGESFSFSMFFSS